MARILGLTFIFLAVTHLAHAQQNFFVGGDLFAGAKRFSGDPSTNTLDGTALGGGVEAGVLVKDHLSLRVHIDVGGKTTASTSFPIGILALPVGVTAPPAPIRAVRSEVTNRIISTDVLFGYQFTVRDRVHVGALGGLSFLHVTRDYNTNSSIALSPVDAAIVAFIVRPYTQVDNVPAATVGGELIVDVTRHLAVVGRLHAHALSLSNGGPSGFTIGPGVGARWTF
jgi:hypothetical protein